MYIVTDYIFCNLIVSPQFHSGVQSSTVPLLDGPSKKDAIAETADSSPPESRQVNWSVL